MDIRPLYHVVRHEVLFSGSTTFCTGHHRRLSQSLLPSLPSYSPTTNISIIKNSERKVVSERLVIHPKQESKRREMGNSHQSQGQALLERLHSPCNVRLQLPFGVWDARALIACWFVRFSVGFRSSVCWGGTLFCFAFALAFFGGCISGCFARLPSIWFIIDFGKLGCGFSAFAGRNISIVLGLFL